MRVRSIVFGLVFLGATGCATAKLTQSTVAGSSASIDNDLRGYDLNLYSGTDGKVFLGCLTCSAFAAQSIANPHGEYGSRFSQTSITNRFSDYGSKYSDNSACNATAKTPPLIRDGNGKVRGMLTVNRQLSPKSDALDVWLGNICEGKEMTSLPPLWELGRKPSRR
jgi:hypothetical protein